MIELARNMVGKSGCANMEYRLGEIEYVLMADVFIGVVIKKHIQLHCESILFRVHLRETIITKADKIMMMRH